VISRLVQPLLSCDVCHIEALKNVEWFARGHFTNALTMPVLHFQKNQAIR
jgi:3-hydroxymyristoyl/3-hydroxydecanoyl-(acyl carrier protein) dehydratase